MKNEFKKKSAIGERLPEQIGKGINAEHLKKVLEARKVNEMNSFKSTLGDKELFEQTCDRLGFNVSEIHRELMLSFIKYNK